MVSFGAGLDACDGYMARSERVGPGVLLLHESFGLMQPFKDFAEALNAEGFTALAPDLYDGVVVSTVEEAYAMAKSLDADEVRMRLLAAARFMTEGWHPRLGVIGFSFGAELAGALAHERPMDASVFYYGLSDIDPDRMSGPLLGHFAEQDDRLLLEGAERSFRALKERGVDAELYVYPGTGHWFANPAVPDAYAPEAAALAWERTVDFLLHHLS